MTPKIPLYFTELPIYKKAIDIIILSRSISTYLNHDLAYLNTNGNEDSHIYFSGDIVQQSTLIAPEIIKAESEYCKNKQHKHFASIERLTNLLYNNCKRLERSNSNGKDYLPILRNELKKFKRLQRIWMMTL